MWRVLSIAQGKSKSPYLQGEFSMLARCASALSMSILVISPGMAQTVSREDAARAAIHPVGTTAAMNHWLSRVPVTRAFPPDFTEELRGRSSARSEEHTSELQSLMRISYAVFCLKKKTHTN